MRARLSLSNLSKSIFGGEGVRRLAELFESATCLHSFNYIKSLIKIIREASSLTSMLFGSWFLWIFWSLFEESSPPAELLRCLDEMRLAIRVMDVTFPGEINAIRL